MPSDTAEPATFGSILGRHRFGLVLSAVLAIIAGACSLAPYVAVYLVTVALFDPNGGGSGAIVWIAIGTAAAIVLRAVAAALSTHIGHVAAYRTLADLRMAIARQLGVLPLGRVQARSTGEMKKLLHDDVEQMEEALAHGVPDLAAAAAVPITTTILLFAVDWRLALVALGSLVLLVVVSGIGMALAAGNNKPFAEHTATLNRAVMGYLQGIKVIRGFLRPDSGYDQARSAIITSASLQHRVTAGPLSWLVSFMMVATGFAIAILLPVAGLQYANGSIDLATLALFLLIGLAYLGPIISLVGVLATIMTRIQFAADAIGEILAEPPLPQSTSPRIPESFDVAFHEVSFSYTDRTASPPDATADGDPASPDGAVPSETSHPVLDSVSLTIPAGARYALVGPTGAGKSTVARLIARFWDPTAGQVTIGGVDVRDIPSAELARLVAFVQQDEYIFAASLRENVRLARPDATDVEVEAAGRAARLEAVADRLESGWDTVLPGGGGNLSGGERQRVSIARALLADAPVVVLDEATAALDAQTERETLAAIDAVTSGRTVIAIAHRLATIRSSDRILYLDDGRISAAGTHEELLAHSPGYATLWNAYTRASGWHLSTAPTSPEIPTSPRFHGTDFTPTDADGHDAAARSIVTPGLGEMGFTRQWITLLGRGWPVLLRRGVPKLILESLLRGIPLLAVFLVLNAAITGITEDQPFDRSLVWSVTGVLVAGLLVRFLAIRWANGTVWTVAADSKADLQLSIVERLRRVPLGFFSRVDNGRITTLVGNDTMMVDFQNIPQQVAAALIQPIYLSVILLILDWRLGLAALIGFPIFIGITIWSDRIYHRVFADVHRARRDATMILIEQAKGAAVLRGNPGSFIGRRFAGAVDRLRDTSIAMSVQAAPAVALGAISVESGLVAVILVGSALYGAGAVSATTLLLFLVISLTVYQPIQELNVLAGYRRNQQEIARKIGEVWDAPILTEPEHPAVAADATIEFRDVTFSYRHSDDPALDDDVRDTVLRNVSFTAPAGTITALVGPSGAGKSTIANLTARLWDVDSGAILIGGHDLRELGSDGVMSLVTTVYQDVYLFNDTVRYNVTLGRPEATDEQIWAALEAAQCDDVVRGLPDGLESVIDDAGTSLSGGQRQRLSIARALLKDSPILILDEAVASVDPDTEARIQDAIGRLAAGRTVLVIAHRLETVRDVDQILTVRDGTVTSSAALPA